MLRNYFMTALRNLYRNKLFSFINISGLAIGLAAAILIVLYIKGELSYDSFLLKEDNVYVLEATITSPGRDPIQTLATPAVLSNFLKNEFPQIDELARVTNFGMNVRHGNEVFNEPAILADPNLLKVLQFPVREGDFTQVLEDNSSIAISEAMAKKYFGETPALGQTLSVIINNADLVFKVGAIFVDLPETSNQQFDFALNIQEEYFPPSAFSTRSIMENWVSFSFSTYAKLRPGTYPGVIEAGIPNLLDRVVPDYVTRSPDIKPSEYLSVKFLPISDIHLSFETGGLGGTPAVNPNTLISFGVAAILILSIASINFMNLVTSQSSLRAREVALRKTLGAKRKQLVTQFLGESVLLVIISLLLAVGIVELLLPFYNELIDKMIATNYFSEPILLAGLSGLAIVVGIGAGLYPAFHLSSFRPARVLNSNQASVEGSSKLRTSLVIIQFSISIGLIIASTVIFSQTKFARGVNLGFDSENLLLVRGLGNANPQDRENFMVRVGQQRGVLSVGNSMVVPTDGLPISTRVTLTGQEEANMVGYVPIGFNFLETYKVTPVARRLFAREFLTDPASGLGEQGQRAEANAVLNETAVRFFGFENAEEALGKTFTAGINFRTDFTVVGVIPDMNFATLRQPLRPEVFNINENGGTISIRYQPENLAALLVSVNEIWAEIFPNQPIFRQFLDENIENLYQADADLGFMLAAFSGLAVVVSALGLFGSSSFSVSLKTKEIGIRKVMGASELKIVKFLVWQFSKPVFAANLIAWPVAWYFTQDWLSGFSVRIELSPLYFLVSGLFALLIAWGTVAGLAYKVARANPIKALKYE